VRASDSDGVDLFQAMENCQAIRYLKPDPVPAELIDRLLWAATRAPSPANSQGWDFIVVDDPAVKARLGQAANAAMSARVAGLQRTDRTRRLMLDGVANLVSTLGQAPVIIFVGGPHIYPPGQPDVRYTWSAAFPAAQNLLLAARALGLGATFTTLQWPVPAFRDILGIPEHVEIAATIPLGWPAARFGPVRRRPVEDFVHRNRWQGDRRGLGVPGYPEG
jgi:nitroreductase